MEKLPHSGEQGRPFGFACDGKCRICPYPGANCKTLTAAPAHPERETHCNQTWMDPETQDAIMKKLHLK